MDGVGDGLKPDHLNIFGQVGIGERSVVQRDDLGRNQELVLFHVESGRCIACCAGEVGLRREGEVSRGVQVSIQDHRAPPVKANQDAY